MVDLGWNKENTFPVEEGIPSMQPPSTKEEVSTLDPLGDAQNSLGQLKSFLTAHRLVSSKTDSTVC